MKLTNKSAVTSFLKDFAEIIEAAAGKQKIVLKSIERNGHSIYVDPLQKSDVHFLIQIYNEVASSTEEDIDLDRIMQDKLEANGLAGINAELLDPSLAAIFRRYEFIKPAETEPSGDFLELPESGAKKTPQVCCAHRHNFFHKPVEKLLSDNNDYDVLYVKPNFFDDKFAETQRLTMPKFGEKNCFSYEARLADYQQTIGKTREDAKSSNGFATLSFFGGLILGLAAIGTAIFLFTILPSALIPLIIIGGLITLGIGIAGMSNGSNLFRRGKIENRTADLMADVALAKDKTYSHQLTK
jgi:hypothetical protein